MLDERLVNIFLIVLIVGAIYKLTQTKPKPVAQPVVEPLEEKKPPKKVRFALEKNQYFSNENPYKYLNNEYLNDDIGEYDEGKWDPDTGDFLGGIWDEQFSLWREGIDGPRDPTFDLSQLSNTGLRPIQMSGLDKMDTDKLEVKNDALKHYYNDYVYKDAYNEYDEVNPVWGPDVKPYFDDNDPYIHPVTSVSAKPYLDGFVLDREKIEENHTVSKVNDLYYNLYKNGNDYHSTPKGKTYNQNRVCTFVDKPTKYHGEICHSHERRHHRIPVLKGNQIRDIYDDLTVNKFKGDKRKPVPGKTFYDIGMNDNRTLKKDRWVYENEHPINGGRMPGGLFANDPFQDNNMALSLWN